MCSGSLGDKGSVEAQAGKKLETEEKNTGLKRGDEGGAVESRMARRYRRRREHMVGVQ